MTRVQRPSDAVPQVVKQLCGLVAQLEQIFPGRHFTLDGHLVGSIGEVLAAQRYDLALLPMSEKTHDAKAADGRLVQVKTTQGRSIGISSEPNYLLVLALDGNGSITEVYNGPGAPAWAAAGKPQKNGQRPIGVSKLRTLMAAVATEERIPTSRQDDTR